MPWQYKPGFRGIARINGNYKFRINTADIQLRQEAQSYLPAYGGSGLKRIWNIGTGDVTGAVSFLLSESDAQYFYDLAYDQDEFYLDLHYYDSEDRRVLGCRIDSFSFSCSAGEIVQCTMNIIGKGIEPRTRSLSMMKGRKLVTWDKVKATFTSSAYLGDAMQSFTYTITNGVKTIKTAANLLPRILTNAIQDVSGEMQFFNNGDIVLPLHGLQENSLGFRSSTFRIDDLSTTHDVVFHRSENVPLTPAVVISTVSWSRVDDFS